MEDIFMIYDALPVICETISEHNLKSFLTKCFNLGWQQMESGIIKDHLFENTLRAVKFVLKCGVKNDANRNVLFEILSSFFETIPLENEVRTNFKLHLHKKTTGIFILLFFPRFLIYTLKHYVLCQLMLLMDLHLLMPGGMFQ